MSLAENILSESYPVGQTVAGIPMYKLRQLAEENLKMREALTRLASMEAFGPPRMLVRVADEELMARINFAQTALNLLSE